MMIRNMARIFSLYKKLPAWHVCLCLRVRVHVSVSMWWKGVWVYRCLNYYGNLHFPKLHKIPCTDIGLNEYMLVKITVCPAGGYWCHMKAGNITNVQVYTEISLDVAHPLKNTSNTSTTCMKLPLIQMANTLQQLSEIYIFVLSVSMQNHTLLQAYKWSHSRTDHEGPEGE